MKTQKLATAAILAILCISACKKSEVPAPDTTHAPSAQQEANTDTQNTEQIQPTAQAQPDQQQPDQQQPESQAEPAPTEQPNSQVPAAEDDYRIFEFENADELKALIAEGVNVNIKDDKSGKTVLFDIDLDFAKDDDYSKAIEIAKILIDAGIDINAKDKEGRTVLFEITHTKDAVPYIKLLLDHGADPKIIANDGTTVLFEVTNKEDYGPECSTEIVKMLINAGADVDVKNKKGQTYLEAADEGCRKAIASALDSDDSEDSEDSDDSDTTTTISLSEKEIKRILSDMDVKPGNVNKPDKQGNTPLFYANTLKEVTALIASGADVNYKNKQNETPLFWLVEFAEDPRVVKAVIDAGANPDQTNGDGKTAIFNANNIDTIRFLAKGGADIYYENEIYYYGERDVEYAIDHVRDVLRKEFKTKDEVDKEIDKLEAYMNAAKGIVKKNNSDSGSKTTEPEKQNTALAGNTIQPQPAAEAKPKYVETIIPPSTDPLTCSLSESPLFTEDSELYYKIKVEQSADGLPEDESEFEFYVLCHVDLKYVSEIYCGSSITCELEPKYNKEEYKSIVAPGLPVEGTWFIDKNGIYHFEKDQFTELTKTTDNGSGEKYIRYIEHEPGTLSWEYKQFKDADPLFPLKPNVKVYDVTPKNSFNKVATKKTVSRTGTVLCYHYSVEGDEDVSIDDICLDDAKGPSSFKKIRNGVADFSLKGTLKAKKR